MKVECNERLPLIAPVIELVVDADCPNVALCRSALGAALERAHLPASWREWDRHAPDTPMAYRHFGSPTVLVNGLDVAGLSAAAPAAGNSCRVYTDETSGRLRGAPSVQSILDALHVRSERER